jgi:hypothetical protein
MDDETMQRLREEARDKLSFCLAKIIRDARKHDRTVDYFAQTDLFLMPTVDNLLQALAAEVERAEVGASEWGVKYAISQFLKMNIENPKAPVNVDEVERRALEDCRRRFSQ